MAGPEVKGSSIFTYLEALKELRGDAAVKATLAELREPLSQQLQFGAISRVGWYPVEAYTELHSATHRALKGGEPLARDIGRKSTELDTQGLLRFLLGISSTDLLLRHAPRVWATYWRNIPLQTEQREPGRCVIRLEDMVGASELVFADIEGGIEMLLSLTNAQEVLVRRRKPNVQWSAAYIVTWRVQ